MLDTGEEVMVISIVTEEEGEEKKTERVERNKDRARTIRGCAHRKKSRLSTYLAGTKVKAYTLIL